MRFAGVFCVVVGLFYLVYVPLSQSSAYEPYLGVLAEVSGAVLRALGQNASVSDAMIVSPGFSVRVVAGCDGMEMVALFVAAVLAFPVALRSRISFMAVGIVVLLTVNLLRIVSLFCVGVYFPTALEAVHWDAWPGVLIVVMLFCWLIWARWAVQT